MKGADDRARLLGFATIQPFDFLAKGARFKTADEYQEFLERSWIDPLAHFAGLAEHLVWEVSPERIGEPGNWFPGGRLNLTVSCLDKWLKADQGTEPVLMALDAQEHTSLTRDEILSRMGVVCERLQVMDLAAGDRVLLALPRGYELLVSMLAVLRLGLTCVPLDPGLGDLDRIRRRAEAAGCQVAVTGESILSGDIRSRWNKLDVQHRLVLETGWEQDASVPPVPVGVLAMHPAFVLADRNGRVFSLPTCGVALHGISAYLYLLDGRGRGDLHWFQTPAHHASFLAGSLGVLIEGGRIATPVTGTLARADRLLEAFTRVKPRVVVIQAKILMRALAQWQAQGEPALEGYAPDLVIIDGTSVAPSFYMTVRTSLFRGRSHLVQVISRPEVSGFIAGPQPALLPVKPACTGPSAPGVGLSVIDSFGESCAPNHGGRLALDHALPGLAVELQSCLPPIPLGLKARRDDNQDLWSVDEVQIDLPVHERVPTTEVEAFISALPGVEQAAVVRVRDTTNRLNTCVFVVLDDPGVVKTIREEITERFGKAEVPQAIQVVSSLPISRSGKLLRTVLRRVATGDTDGLDQMKSICDPEVIRELIDTHD